MKFKKTIGLIAASIIILFSATNTGLAATVKKKIDAIFGSHIVQVNNKSTKINTLSYNNKIYVPVIELTTSLGGEYAVSKNILKLKAPKKEDGITIQNINYLKYVSELQHQYELNRQLAMSLQGEVNYLNEAYRELRSYGTRVHLDNIKHNSEIHIEAYDMNVDNNEELLKKLQSRGYNVTTDRKMFTAISNDLSDTLDYLKIATDSLEDLYTNPNSPESAKHFSTNTNKAWNSANDVIRTCYIEEDARYRIIQKY
jgi:hypothetical protein